MDSMVVSGFSDSDFKASPSEKVENLNGPEQAGFKQKEEVGFDSEDPLACGNLSDILRTILPEFQQGSQVKFSFQARI